MQEKQGLKGVYKLYKESSSRPTDFRTFKRVWETFIDQVIQVIILEGRDFIMPSLGTLGIRKSKVIVKMTPEGDIDKRYLRPDWKKTKELWARDSEAKEKKQLVFHLNKHFNGFNVKWWWDKRTCIVPNHSAYALVMSRANKRKLSGAIYDENTEVDYYEQKPMI
jgi:hypothetical protein